MELIFLLTIFSNHLFCQDSLLVKSIDETIKGKYDRQNKTFWFLTRETVVKGASQNGTVVSISMVKDTLFRIICIGTNRNGRFGIAYKPTKGKLAFFYSTMEYYSDDAVRTNFTNWKGYYSLEVRAFYKSGKLLQERHNGFGHGQQVVKMPQFMPEEFNRIFHWVQRELLPGAGYFKIMNWRSWQIT